jgi:hypothetical protein
MALTQQQFMQLMGGKREPVTASLASVLDLIKKPLDYYAIDKRVPLVGGQSAADLIGLTGTQSLVQDFSQGKPMMRDGLPDERFIDAAGMIPMVKPAAVGAGQAAKYLGKEALRQVDTGTGVFGKIVPDMNMYAVPNNSPFVPNVKAGEELLVQHNLTPEKLIAANKLGGMPVPSLAINKLNNPISGFGDISLIGSKEMAIPSAKNPIYKSDAYTKRAPNINYNIDFKSQQNLEGLLSDVIDKVPSGQAKFGSLTQDYKYRADNKLLKAKFLQEQNALPDRSLFQDDYKYLNEIDNLVNENTNKYSSWLNNFEANLPNLGVNVEERLFKGYTPSGNRKYAPVTLENIIKEMKGGASSEGWNYGVGNIRALVTPKFKNLKEITSSRERLISNKDFAPIKDKFDEGYNNLASRLREINSSYDANDALLDIAENKNFSVLKDQYTNVPDSLKADIQTYFDSLKKMPTEYFEIKPQRAVSIGEFQGAIIPKNTPKEAKDILSKQGIKDIYEYSTPEERLELFKKFGNKMFSAGFPIGVGSGLLDSKQKTD